MVSTEISSIDDSLSVCAALLTDFFLCRDTGGGGTASPWGGFGLSGAGAGIVLVSLVTLIDGGTEIETDHGKREKWKKTFLGLWIDEMLTRNPNPECQNNRYEFDILKKFKQPP